MITLLSPINKYDVFFVSDLAMTPAMQSVAWLAVLVVPLMLYMLSVRMGLIASYICVAIALCFAVGAWKDLEGASASMVSVYMPWAMAITVGIHGVFLMFRGISLLGTLSAVGMIGISLIMMKDMKGSDLTRMRNHLLEEELAPAPEKEETKRSKRRVMLDESFNNL